MSGTSYDSECPNCNKQMMSYSDYKPFDTIGHECLFCGFSAFTKTYFDSFKSLNERRKDYGKKPISKKQYDKIKRDKDLGIIEE